jgi:hydrogenase maturation protease
MAFLETLIIGYGNTLRGDDGVGRYLADQIAVLHWPHCQVLSVHQLTPELAAAIALADQVIFIDAQAVDPESSSGLSIETLQPLENQGEFGHRGSPTELLMLAKLLYDKAVNAWWVLIPAVNFDYGETLSSLTQKYQLEALNSIQQLVNPINTDEETVKK